MSFDCDFQTSGLDSGENNTNTNNTLAKIRSINWMYPKKRRGRPHFGEDLVILGPRECRNTGMQHTHTHSHTQMHLENSSPTAACDSTHTYRLTQVHNIHLNTGGADTHLHKGEMTNDFISRRPHTHTHTVNVHVCRSGLPSFTA